MWPMGLLSYLGSISENQKWSTHLCRWVPTYEQLNAFDSGFYKDTCACDVRFSTNLQKILYDYSRSCFALTWVMFYILPFRYRLKSLFHLMWAISDSKMFRATELRTCFICNQISANYMHYKGSLQILESINFVLFLFLLLKLTCNNVCMVRTNITVFQWFKQK